MTIPWDEDLYNTYQAMSEEVFDLWKTGRQADAEKLGEKWWAEVPDFEDFPERQLAIPLARVIAEAGRTDLARTWLERGREAYHAEQASDHAKSFIGFTDGVITFCEGKLDRAFELMKASYDFMGKRAFDFPKDQRYWDFFAERAGLTRPAVASGKSLEKLAAEGDQLQSGGDPEGAIALWEQAINRLGPNPVEHSMAMWFFASIADAEFELRRWSKADAAAGQALIAGGNDNAFVWLRKGQALVEVGEQEAGIEALTSAYMLEGDEIFEDEDPKYRKLLVDGGVIRS